MLTDQELIDGLRHGLAPLQPTPELIDEIRHRAAVSGHRRTRRIRVPPDGYLTRVPRAVFALVVVGLSAGVLAAAFVVARHRAADPAAGHPHPSAAVTLRGDGIAEMTFGASLQRLRSAIEPILGSPVSGSQDSRIDDCGVDEELVWPIVLNPKSGHLDRSEELILTFDHGRFVGYQYGGEAMLAPGQRLQLDGETARGLRVGDSLATGRRLYGRPFQISSAQGGSWQVRTPQGPLAGYTDVTARHTITNPRNLIATIDAGDVGCPAESP